MNFENKLKRLEEIVESMESGDLALENSLKLFEEGVKLTKECHSELNQAEQKVKTLLAVDAQGNAILKDFISEE
jgi:exodeoxyribonuclease VII small subunit